MNEHLLLDLATDLAYEIALSGGETYRVEETVKHILRAYGLAPEVAALPNYLIVSVLSETGEPITRMRMIGAHGNNFDAVERMNALSRTICTTRPKPEKALEMLERTKASVQYYSLPMRLLGHFLGAAGFGLLFGCSAGDAALAGLCGILVAFATRFTSLVNANPIFSTLASSFLLSLAAYGMNALGWVGNADTVIIGGMMILVPGLVFTNALRDMIYGDINSGINNCVQVLLIAGSMALGSAGARNLITRLVGLPSVTPAMDYGLLMLCIASFLGCVGFSILFNIHGPGMFLCALGGIASYATFYLSHKWGLSPDSAIFLGTMFSALYSEIMARIRKYPTICYLVVSIIPLIPGASLYYTMVYATDRAMDHFVSQGLLTAQTTGIMAASIILVSSLVKIYYGQKAARRKKSASPK